MPGLNPVDLVDPVDPVDPDELARSLSAPMVFVDLETTGGNALSDRITEIGVVEVGPNGIEQWSTLLDPAESIPLSFSN